MSNMSYCRFQNTLGDLQDCYNDMDVADSSDDEQKAYIRLIKLCCDIAMNHGDEVGRYFTESEDDE